MSTNNPQSWLDIAEDDLASAQKLAAPPSPHWKTAVYHCQQAAEKAIKALLVQHDGMLLKKLERHDIGLPDLRPSASAIAISEPACAWLVVKDGGGETTPSGSRSSVPGMG